MGRVSKKRKEALSKIDASKAYSLTDACNLVKEVSTTKFDASVDVSIRLGVDPRKANQMVRGTVALPHGTGKDVKVLVLCTPDKEEEAKAAGADYVGLDEYIDKIKGGWTDVSSVARTGITEQISIYFHAFLRIRVLRQIIRKRTSKKA